MPLDRPKTFSVAMSDPLLMESKTSMPFFAMLATSMTMRMAPATLPSAPSSGDAFLTASPKPVVIGPMNPPTFFARSDRSADTPPRPMPDRAAPNSFAQLTPLENMSYRLTTPMPASPTMPPIAPATGPNASVSPPAMAMVPSSMPDRFEKSTPLFTASAASMM